MLLIYSGFKLIHLKEQVTFDHQANIFIERSEQKIRQTLHESITTIRNISNSTTFESLEAPSQQDLKQLEEQWRQLIATDTNYDQVRILSPDGFELIRLEQQESGIASIDEKHLQNKSDRYYYTESLKLDEGQVFVSRLDLNIDYGEIEEPNVPTIRFAMPIFNNERTLSFILVLNFDATTLLLDIRNIFSTVTDSYALLTHDGYWLIDSNENREWGFANGTDTHFSDYYPELWSSITNSDSPEYLVEIANQKIRKLYIDLPVNQLSSEQSIRPWIVVLRNAPLFSVTFFENHFTYLFPLLLIFPLGTGLVFYWSKASAGREIAEKNLLHLNKHLEQKVAIRTKEALAARDAISLSLATLAETRDNETGLHIKRTQLFVEVLAYQLRSNGFYRDELCAENIDLIKRASILHDIGKVGVPDSILLKPNKLTDNEFTKMKTHTTLGKEALDRAIEATRIEPNNEEDAFLACARDIAHYHHERWDGCGYPAGLKADSIPLCARLVALVDVYDALVSMRIYKEPFSKDEAERIILNSNGQFDPRILAAFELAKEQFWKIKQRYDDSYQTKSLTFNHT